MAPNPEELQSYTEAKGIHQSDVIIRTALILAMRDLRANPWLLDHVFATLIEDEATAQQYGDKERAQAKAWFLKTDIPVVMDYRMEPPEGTCLSISLVDSTEAELTLGDVHYQPVEAVESAWAPLAGPFAATYNPTSGVVEVPTAVSDKLFISPGQLLIDKAGGTHEILTAIDETSFTIAPGVLADFKTAFIKGRQPRLIRRVESALYKESYRIGIHALGDPFVLNWLYSIVLFSLLRYKMRLLEARGFERSSLSVSPFAKDERWSVQNMWTRFISITGYVRQYWPADISERVTSVSVSPLQAEGTENPDEDTFIPEPGFTAETAPWLAEDGLDAIQVEEDIDDE